MCWRRSTRCQGSPERDSSCVSPREADHHGRDLAGTSARGTSSRRRRRAACGSRPRRSTSISGVVTFSTCVIGERAAKSCGSSHGALRNQVGWNSVKSAVYQKPHQSAMSRCETAALKRCGLRDRPVGQQPAAAAAGDAEPVRVDVALLQHLVHAGHQILVVVAGIVVLDDVAEVLAVRRAAARVGDTARRSPSPPSTGIRGCRRCRRRRAGRRGYRGSAGTSSPRRSPAVSESSPGCSCRRSSCS